MNAGWDAIPIVPRALGPGTVALRDRIVFAQSEALGTSASDGPDVQYANATYDGCSVYHSPPRPCSPDGTELVSNGGFKCLGTFFEGQLPHRDRDRCGRVRGPLRRGVIRGNWSPDSRWILVGSSSRDRGLHYFGDGDFVELTSGGAFDGASGNAGVVPRMNHDRIPPRTSIGSPGSPQMYLIDAADGGNMRPLGGPHVGMSPDWQPLVGPSRADYRNAATVLQGRARVLGRRRVPAEIRRRRERPREVRQR